MNRQSPQRVLVRWLAAAAVMAFLPIATALADPPSRVARLAVAEGAVSFSPAGDNDWVRANLNRPLVTGDRLWSDADGRVEIQFAGAAARMGALTNVTLVNLDDRMQQFQLTQGTVYLRVRGLVGGEQIEIDTPNFAFVVAAPGVYRFDVDPDDGTSTVDVRSGEGTVYGDGAAYRIAGGQAVRFRGTNLRDSVALGLPPPDPFERWAQTRDARYDRLPSARYVAPDVIGYEDLDAYGTWRSVANIGNVWMPRAVPAGWAPYRNGHWAWIDPWGWSWVDDAPWGFAPFHYGRWALVEDRWGWVPGPVRQRAVYAPALVAFVGGANFSLSVSGGQAIGWFPLGPGEVYRPAYTVSRDYFTRVNVTNTVINTTYVTNIYNSRDRVTDVRYANFARPAAITAVSPAVFTQAQPVQRAAFAVDRQLLDKAQVIPLAKVAPQRESVTGASPAARAAPPSSMQKQVIAKAAPPPAPVPLESKLPALRTAPGRPLDRAAADTARSGPGQPAAPSPAMPSARVVKAVDPNAPPAQMPRGSSAAERGKGSGKGSDTSRTTQPGAAPAPVPAPPPSTASPRQDMKAPLQPPASPRQDAKSEPPPQAPTSNAKGGPPPPEQRAAPPTPAALPPSLRGGDVMDRQEPAPRENAKGPPSRDQRGAQSRPAQENAPAAPRPRAQAEPLQAQQAQPQQAQQSQPPQGPKPQEQQRRPQQQQREQPPPQQSVAAPPAATAQPAPVPPPVQRAAESGRPGNGASQRSEVAPPRAPAPQAAPQPAPPPQAAPRGPPQPRPQPAPPQQAAPIAPPQPAPVQQAAPKAPPQPAAADQAQGDDAPGKGKGNDKRRKEDDDKKP